MLIKSIRFDLEKETLEIYVHILGMYLTESGVASETSATTTSASKTTTARTKQLTDIVIQKILTLGKNYKQELKQVLDKSPSLKTKFGNALRISTSTTSSSSMTTPGGGAGSHSSTSQVNKTPKIQLNFNFSKK